MLAHTVFGICESLVHYFSVEPSLSSIFYYCVVVACFWLNIDQILSVISSNPESIVFWILESSTDARCLSARCKRGFGPRTAAGD